MSSGLNHETAGCSLQQVNTYHFKVNSVKWLGTINTKIVLAMTDSYNVRPPVKEKDCTFLNLQSEKRGTRQKYIYFKHTEIYTWKKARVKFVRNTKQTNLKSERLQKYIVRPIRDTNDSTSQWRAKRARLSVKTKWKQKCQDLFSLKEQ